MDLARGGDLGDAVGGAARPGSLAAFDLLLWGFVLAGAGLRLWGLSAMEFKGDEVGHLLGAYQAAQAPWSAPLLRSEGTTVSPGIFFYQLLALPISATRDPIAVARLVALLNVAAIPVLFLLVRQLFDSRIALWATALFVTAPWMLVFSRKIWNPDLLVPFLLLTLFCLVSAMRRYAPWKGYAFAVLLALLSQLHLSVWLALFPLLPLGLLLRPWRRPLHLAGGIATFVAVYLVTLGPRTGEFVTTLFSSSTSLEEARLLRLVSHNSLWSIRLASGPGFQYLLGPGGYESFARHPIVGWSQVVFWSYAVVAGVAVTFVLHRLLKAAPGGFREVADRFLLILVLMAVSVHLAYLGLGIVSFPHYHVVLSLLAPLAVALSLRRVVEQLRGAGRVLVPALLVVVLATNVAFTGAFLRFVASEPESIDGDYGQPYFVERERWEAQLRDGIEELDGV